MRVFRFFPLVLLAALAAMTLIMAGRGVASPGNTERVSVDSGGNEESLSPAISADGRYVAFDSGASNLVAADTNGSWDVVAHDRDADGDGSVDFYVLASSTDGVHFSSTQAGSNVPMLVPQWSGTDPVFVGASDIGSKSGDGDEATARLLDAIFAGNPPGGVFTAGDNVNEDPVNLADFMAYYVPTWGRHKARTRPTAGNHDYLDTAGVAQGYFDYFNGTGNFTGPAGDRDKGYYSYDLGAWHIVVLNSNCSKVGGCVAGSPQEQWLRSDLAAHPTACTAAMWHHPRFSSGQHPSYSSMQAFWQALYDYGAEVVFSGHNHVYERFAPQDASGKADAMGIREFVVGTGGKSHYIWGSVPLPNEEVRNNDTWGVIKLTLHPTSYDWEFIPVAGKTFSDSGTQPCIPLAAVGGMAELPGVSDSSTPNDTLLAGLATVALATLTAGTWYARRRFSRS
jgi:hypothetical protein